MIRDTFAQALNETQYPCDLVIGRFDNSSQAAFLPEDNDLVVSGTRRKQSVRGPLKILVPVKFVSLSFLIVFVQVNDFSPRDLETNTNTLKTRQVSKCFMHTWNLTWKTSGRVPVETCGSPSSFITTFALCNHVTARDKRAKTESSKTVPACLARSAAVVLQCKHCGKSITHKLFLDNPTKLPPGKKDRSLAPDPNFLVIAHPHLKTMGIKHLASMLHAPMQNSCL